MNLKTIRIEFDPPDIQKVLTISLDDDKEGALHLIKDNLAKRIQKALTPHWVPVFEASYAPSQTERFKSQIWYASKKDGVKEFVWKNIEFEP